MEILHNLGVDGRILLAQIVNFLVLLFVLQRFVYRPLLAFLDARAGRIEQGLKDAEAARLRLDEAESERSAMLEQARKDARELMERSEIRAHQLRQELSDAAHREAEKIIVETRKSMSEERRRTILEAREELATLVIAATEKVISAKLDTETDKALIEESIGTMKRP